jgi:DNA adenine methylase
MKYMGSKNRIAKEILPIMLKERGQRTWVEPFVGGANVIDKVDGIRIGTQLTFGCEWWGSFRRDNIGKRKYDLEAYNNVMNQQPNLIGVEFNCGDYRDLLIPERSFIYCDPPYRGVRKYVGNVKFDSDIFWQWCRDRSMEGHIVYVSEYSAPDDFECIWSKEISASVNNSIKSGRGLKAVEKLFKFSPTKSN